MPRRTFTPVPAPGAAATAAEEAREDCKGDSRAKTPENAPATVSANVATSQKDLELAAFRDGRLENIHGEDTRSTPVYDAWKQYCAEHGIEPGSQKAFCQRLQALGIGYTRQGNRPRYLNVRLKPAVLPLHAPLRLAVNNA